MPDSGETTPAPAPDGFDGESLEQRLPSSSPPTATPIPFAARIFLLDMASPPPLAAASSSSSVSPSPSSSSLPKLEGVRILEDVRPSPSSAEEVCSLRLWTCVDDGKCHD